MRYDVYEITPDPSDEPWVSASFSTLEEAKDYLSKKEVEVWYHDFSIKEVIE